MPTGGVVCMCLSSFMTSTVLLYPACKYDTVSWLSGLHTEAQRHALSVQSRIWKRTHRSRRFKFTSHTCSYFTWWPHVLSLFTLVGCWTQRTRRTVKVKLCSHHWQHNDVNNENYGRRGKSYISCLTWDIKGQPKENKHQKNKEHSLHTLLVKQTFGVCIQLAQLPP